MNTRSCHHAVWICVCAGIASALLESSIRGAPPVVDTRSASTPTAVTSEELERLPQGRDPYAVLRSAPGVPPRDTSTSTQVRGGFSGPATIPPGDALSGWYLEPVFGVQTGSVDITHIGGPIIRDAVIAPIFGSGSGGVINLGLSRNRDFRDRERDEIPNQRVLFDPANKRLVVDPRSFFEIEHQLERGLTRREIAEELNDVYRLTVNSVFRREEHSPSDTGGFGGLAVGRLFSFRGYDQAKLEGSFFYNHNSAPSRFEPFVHVGVLVTGTSLDFSTGENVTARQRVSTFYRPQFIDERLEDDPGVIFQTNLWGTQQTSVDLDTYKITGNLGVGVRCPCGLELGVNLQPGIRIDDFEGQEIRRIYLGNHKLGERKRESSDSDVNFYLGLEAKVGYPLGQFGYLKAAIGTQIAGDTPEFRVGRSQVNVSDDPGDNLYGSLSLSIPFENVFGR